MGKFGKFGESFVIRQTKTIQINNLLADLLIYQFFFHKMLEKNQFAKLSHYTVRTSINTIYTDHCSISLYI